MEKLSSKHATRNRPHETRALRSPITVLYPVILSKALDTAELLSQDRKVRKLNTCYMILYVAYMETGMYMFLILRKRYNRDKVWILGGMAVEDCSLYRAFHLTRLQIGGVAGEGIVGYPDPDTATCVLWVYRVTFIGLHDAVRMRPITDNARK